MSEEQTRALLQELQTLETYIVDMNQRETTMLSMLREATTSIESIKALKEKPNSEAILPIGLGAYVKGAISSSDKILVNVGANVVIEKDTDSAMNYLEARIKEIQVAMQETSSRKQNAMAALERGKAQINQMMQAMSKNPGSNNV